MAVRPSSPPAPTRPRVEQLECRLAPAVTVRFDYSYDTSGFFADSARRAAVENAATAIAGRLNDDLAAIAPGGQNSWKASVFNPATNSTITLDNPLIREDEVVVYLGAARLPGDQLGLTTTGGFSAAGGKGWLTTVRTRGQAGAAAGAGDSDYATWGGMITFDSDVSWSSSLTAAPPAGQFDLESVATHELLHIFGFGIGQPAFARNVTGWDGSKGQFTGPAVSQLMGGPVGVTGDSGVPDHWAAGTAFLGRPSPVQAAIPAGVKRTVTELDLAALKDTGWQVDIGTVVTTAAPARQTAEVAAPLASSPAVAEFVFTADAAEPAPVQTAAPATARFAIGTPSGAVAVDAAGRSVQTVTAGGGGAGAVRVASADFTGDGRPDTVVGTAPGVSNRVTVASASGTILADFAPFEAAFTGGVYVTAGDLTGDGVPDLVVTPDQGGGPVVAVFDGAALARGQVAPVRRFLGIEDASFRGGARAAVGDITGDGVPDLVVAAGTGGGPRVSLYDGQAFRAGRLVHPAADFFAFESGLRNGVFPAVADVDGDGVGDILCGAGPGGSPRVTAFSGRDLTAGRLTVAADFLAGDSRSRDGVRLGVADLTGDGQEDVLTAAGGGNQVNVYAADDLGQSGPRLTVGVPVPTRDGLFVG